MPGWPAWRRLLRNTYVRVGSQLAIGTTCLLAVFSTPTVWNALALDPVLANPALILMLFSLVVLISLGTGLAPLQLAAENMAGGLLGGALGLGCIYLTLAAAGSGNTPTKAVLNIIFSATPLFLLTLLRFKYRQWNLLFVMASLTLAIDAAASYHQTSGLWKFSVHWWAYAAIAGAASLLCTTLVFPIPAGAVVRKSLAQALRTEGRLMVGVVEVLTGEVDQQTGLLAAATGETSRRIGIDSGLFGAFNPIYEDATTGGKAVQVGWRYLGPAKLEVDLYRAQRRFPHEPFRLLVILARSMLSSSMMLVYPVQTGHMHVALCRRLREQLLALAVAYRDCCTTVAAVLEENAPLLAAVQQLGCMEEAFAALSAAARVMLRASGALGRSQLALDSVLSLLFTICTRLRRMFLLLPGALGRDQPGAVAAVVAHFQASRSWSFQTMTQVPPTRPESLDLLRASLLDAGIGLPAPKRTPSAQALALAAQPSLLVMPAREAQRAGLVARVRAGGRRLWVRTGFTTHQLKLGVQLVTAYTILMVLVSITPVNNALGGRAYWSVFIIVAILEPSTGGVIFKGFCRLLGTLLGGGAGLATTYFVYLVNGLSYENRPTKFIVMSIVLGLLAGAGAAAAVRFPKYQYVFIIYTILLGVVALPGYTTDAPMPRMALWRLVTTLIGIAVEVLVAVLVFPVTARDLFAATMAKTLEELADVADAAFRSVLPARSTRRRLGTPSVAPLGPTQQPAPGVGSGGVHGLQEQSSLRDQEKPAPLQKGEDGWGAGAPWQPGQPPSPATCSARPAAAAAGEVQLSSMSASPRRTGAGQHPQGTQLAAPAHADLLGFYPVPREEGGEMPPDRAYPVVEEEGEEGEATPAAAAAESRTSQEQQQQQLTRWIESGEGIAIGKGQVVAMGSSGSGSRSDEPHLALDMRGTSASSGGSRDGSRHGGVLGLRPGSAGNGQLGPVARGRGSSSREGSRRGGALGLLLTRAGSQPTGAAAGALAAANGSGGLERALSTDSWGATSVGGLSVYAPLEGGASHRVFGTIYMRMLPAGLQAGADIVTLMQLEAALHYEWYARRPHRFPFVPAFRAQRLCRHMLNVIAAFAITMDSQETREVRGLRGHASRVDALVKQLQECMRAFAGLVRGHVAASSAVELVANLEQHAVRLFLAVVLEGAGAGAERVSDSELMQGLAFLGLTFNAAYVARLLCIALVQTFHAGRPAEIKHVSALLEDPTRWAADDALALLAGGLLGVAMGTASDPATPRAGGAGGGYAALEALLAGSEAQSPRQQGQQQQQQQQRHHQGQGQSGV